VRPSQAASPDALELIGLLERAVGDGACAAAGVPAATWRDALLEPLREFLCRPSKGVRARLLELGFRVGGGIGAPPRELPLLVEILHAGSLIIDDIEDDSAARRGAATMHRRYGVPVALNAANWLYFWAQALLGRTPLDDAARLEAYGRLAECLMRAHEGQALDLTVRVDELAQVEVPEVVQAIMGLKTGSLLGLAMALGAVAAGAPAAARDAIDAFGREAGIALQMLDDLSGLLNPGRRAKAIEDLRLGRATWVWSSLARDLDPEAYEPLRAALAEVRAGAPAEPLVERIRFRLGAGGLGLAHAQLARGREALCAAIGAGPWWDDVHAEFAWLERQYLERSHGAG
jgi:geranylgeranyl pyrophosphate synthase